MQHVRDVMAPAPPTVSPSTKVEDLARLLVEQDLDGTCVVEDGRLVGVVTSMDLIYKEKRLHVPTFFAFLDAVIPVTGTERMRAEIEKITGAKVADIMSRKPITVTPGTAVEDAASLMVEKHLTVLPVVEDGRLVGMVTKPGLLKAAFGF